MEEKEYSVSEAVRLIGVESHVLRYWEEELQVDIRRTGQGHRIYSEKDVELFRRVRNLKEKGIQLKAIRILLENTGIEGEETEDALPQQILDIEQESHSDCCELVAEDAKPDNLKQFEMILKQMVEEVVTEQNEKLERAIAGMIREEIGELYLQYYGITQEAAASSDRENKEEGRLVKLVKRLAGRKV